jgi:tetratricopeptide (TPR) repeat protein
MRQLAEKIMAMDPELAESHVVSGRIAMLEMRWSDTEAAYRQALMINPGNINALEALSGLMGVMARPLEALEFAQVALARDPLGLQALGRVSVAYTLLGKCTQAEEDAQRALKLSNEAGRFNGRIADCWLMHHDEYTKAIEWYEKEPLEFLRDTGLAIAYNKLGQQDRAQQSLDNLIELNGEDASYQYGQIYAQWGQPEKALDHLQHAWEIRDPGFILLKMDRFLDPIRDEPAFIPLMEFWQDPAKR